MSNLADKTEYRALRIIAQMVKQFEKLHYMDMTKIDDWDAIQARNLLEGVIQSNGYKINYDRGSNKPILKL
ncbi:hypothetical protein SAMN05421747_1201 [Parapedobacter composti]|uniref:Uncharacterized protein n=1 Tax=Parapedobacter composti TaxID=623281 RepID=A0A1I1LB27_9SPHI|nr:hypothetical protein [Parapedobacter composti]SFC69732.1 hypothetical protein SAMN05421747_1201 [Parapedobacter composti]